MEIRPMQCFYCLNQRKSILTHRVLIDESKPDLNASYAYFHTACMDNVLRNYVREKKEILSNENKTVS